MLADWPIGSRLIYADWPKFWWITTEKVEYPGKFSHKWPKVDSNSFSKAFTLILYGKLWFIITTRFGPWFGPPFTCGWHAGNGDFGILVIFEDFRYILEDFWIISGEFWRNRFVVLKRRLRPSINWRATKKMRISDKFVLTVWAFFELQEKKEEKWRQLTLPDLSASLLVKKRQFYGFLPS